MDPRRGPPVMGGNRWASTDMNYHLGSSSGEGGSNNITRMMTSLEEAGESPTGGMVGYQESGKGPESSRPPIRKPSQPSPKLVAARSSGSRRLQRSHHPGWHVLNGFADGHIEAGSESVSMDADGNLGMGLGTHLGFSEEIIVHPAHVHSAHVQPLSNSEFLGRGVGRPGASTLDFLSGRNPIQGNNFADCFGGRTAGEMGDDMSLRVGPSGLPPLGNRQVQIDAGATFSGSRTGPDERIVDGAGGSMMFNSLFVERQDLNGGVRSVMNDQRYENTTENMMFNSFYMERPDYQDEAQLQGSSSNFMGATETFLPGSGRNQSMYDDSVGCSSDGRRFLADRHPSVGNVGGAPLEMPSGSHGHVSSSSRSSACKRKSCAPVVAGSLSCRSGSPHRTAFRDSYSGRVGGSSGAIRRTAGSGGCTSSSDIVASGSSPPNVGILGRYGEPLSVAPGLEEPFSRRTNFMREPIDLSPDILREGRYGKSVAGCSNTNANSQRTTRTAGVGVMLTNPGVTPSPPFSRTVRRAMPSHDNMPRRMPVSDSSMDADEGILSSSLRVDQMFSASQPRRSDSPFGGGRNGASGSPRPSDAPFGTSPGDRLMHRYLGSSTRGLSSTSSSASQLGPAVPSESRMRSRGISHYPKSLSHASSLSQPVPLTLQTPVHPASSSAPSPSRPPPHPPTLRGRLHGSNLQTLLPPPSPSGPAPSRLPPSPPLNPLSFAPSIDALPSPRSLFRGSLLHGSPAAGLRDRGFASAAESLLGIPFRGLQMSGGDGGSQPRLVEGLAEVGYYSLALF